MARDVEIDQRVLAELFDGPNSLVGRDLAKRAVKVESAAKRGAPVDTGRLRSSITHEIDDAGDRIVARIGTDVDYAPHVELGTSRMSARPFLRPALDAGRR